MRWFDIGFLIVGAITVLAVLVISFLAWRDAAEESTLRECIKIIKRML